MREATHSHFLPRAAGFFRAAVLAAVLGPAGRVCARGIGAGDAELAAGNWLRRGVSVFRPAGSVRGTETVAGETGGALFHVVKLVGGGFVVMSADDGVHPVVAFSSTEDGEFMRDPGSPLAAFLRDDLSRRMEGLRRRRLRPAFAAGPAVAAAVPAVPAPVPAVPEPGSPEARWAELLAPGPLFSPAAVQPFYEVDDERVAPLVKSKWNQGGARGGYCYNYCTPGHYVCGCAPLAFAQILRYHEYPKAAVARLTRGCGVDGVETNLTTIGGVYDWGQMPLRPDECEDLTEGQRYAIGKLCYDMGVVCHAGYRPGGTGAGPWCFRGDAASYHYASALEIGNFGAGVADLSYQQKVLFCNFDAGMPVAMQVGGNGSHEIVADGYGFIGDIPYVHVNMGWGGAWDAWYAFPNVQSFTSVQDYIYNIFPTNTGNIVSGRTLDADGLPVGGVSVTAEDAASGRRRTAVSAANGVWALILPSAETNTYNIFAGADESSGREVTLREAKSGNTADGVVAENVWGVDLTAEGPSLPRLYWNGGDGGVWEAEGREANWLTEGGAATVWERGSAAVFTNGGAAVIAPGGVSACAVCFESPGGGVSLTGGPLELTGPAKIAAADTGDVFIGAPLRGTNGLNIVHGRELVFEGFLSGEARPVFRGVRLEALGMIGGFMEGKWVDAPSWAAPCQDRVVPGGGRSIQFQLADDAYTKCVKVVFTQNGEDVYARVERAMSLSGTGHVGTDFDREPEVQGQPWVSVPGGEGYGISRLTAGFLPGRFAIGAPAAFEGNLRILGGRVELAGRGTLGAGGFFGRTLRNKGQLVLSGVWQTFGGAVTGPGRIELRGGPGAGRVLHSGILPAGEGAEPVTVAAGRSLADLSGVTGRPAGADAGGGGAAATAYLPFHPEWHGAGMTNLTLHLQMENGDGRTRAVVVELVQRGPDVAARALRAYSRAGRFLGRISGGDAMPAAAEASAAGCGVRDVELFFGCPGAAFTGSCGWTGGVEVSGPAALLAVGGGGLPERGTIAVSGGGSLRFHAPGGGLNPVSAWSGGVVELRAPEVFSKADEARAVFLEGAALRAGGPGEGGGAGGDEGGGDCGGGGGDCGNYVNVLDVLGGGLVEGGALLAGAPAGGARLKVSGGVCTNAAGYCIAEGGALGLDVEDAAAGGGPGLVFTGGISAGPGGRLVKRGGGSVSFRGAVFRPGDFSVEGGEFRFEVPAGSGFCCGRFGVCRGAAARFLPGVAADAAALELEAGAALCFGVEANRCALFSAGSLSLPGEGRPEIRVAAGGAVPAGAEFVLIGGAGLSPGAEDGFALDLSAAGGFSAALRVEDGSLVLGPAGGGFPAASGLTWRGGEGGDGAWNGDAGNRVWLSGAGEAAAFAAYSPVQFRVAAAVTAEVEVAEGTAPGAFLDESAGEVRLCGARLRGAAPVRKTGCGTLTIAGGGLEDQPVTVTNGVLKIGAGAPGTALGNPAVPLAVLPGGTLDLNGGDGNGGAGGGAGGAGALDKAVRISGSGFGGLGAVVNRGGGAGRDLSALRLAGDATVAGPGGWALRRAGGRASLTGPGDAALTVAGPMAAGAAVGLADADVAAGELIVRDGGALAPSGATRFAIGRLTLDNGGAGLFDDVAGPMDFPVLARGAGVNRLGNAGGRAELAGPVTVEAGARLELCRVRDEAARMLYTGGLAGPGGLLVSGATHVFGSDADIGSMAVTGGTLQFGDEARDETQGRRLPRNVALTNGTLVFASGGRDALYTNLTVTGRTGGDEAAFVPGFSKGRHFTVLRDLTVDLPEDGRLRLGVPPSDSRGFAALGAGTSVRVRMAELLYRADAGEAFLSIGEGASLTVLGSDPAEDKVLLIGHWPSSAPCRLSVDGGTLSVPNCRPEIGWDGKRARLYLNGGVLNAPNGIGIRTHMHYGYNPEEYEEMFIMNGGEMNFGGGFFTRLDHPRGAVVHFNGGTLRCLTDWRMPGWLPVEFGPYGAAPGSFTLDTAGKSVSFPTALRGDADVRITGEGRFEAANGFSGGLGGHWTIENGGGADLRNAAAFAGGLSLSNGASALIRIGGPDRCAAMGAFTKRGQPGNGPFLDDFFRDGRAWGDAACALHPALAVDHGAVDTAIGFSGDFEVTEAGDYTFGVAYDDRARLVIDGEEVCGNDGWDQVGTGVKHLGAGWHSFRLTAQNDGGAAGIGNGEWRAAGLAAGWKKGTNTADRSAASFRRFDTDAFRMRPSASARLRRVGRAREAALDEWRDRLDYNDSETVGSLKNTLHSHTWPKAWGSVNDFTGWFRVERDGDWVFKGTYDDRIAFWVDGALLLETVRWDDEKTSAPVHLSRGLHRFRARVMDTSGNAGGLRATPDDRVLWYSTDGGASFTLFDEDTLTITAEPYGFIGGALELAAGSSLTNAAADPCPVTGVLRGAGTLSGPFRLDGAVWEVSCDPGAGRADAVFFENPCPDALAGVGKIRVFFGGRPRPGLYEIGPAPGLPADPGALAAKVEVSAEGGAAAGIRPELRDGRLFLRVPAPRGTVVIVM